MSVQGVAYLLGRPTIEEMAEECRQSFFYAMVYCSEEGGDYLDAAASSFANAYIHLSASSSEGVITAQDCVSDHEAEAVFRNAWTASFSTVVGYDASAAEDAYPLDKFNWSGAYPRLLLEEAGKIVGRADAERLKAISPQPGVSGPRL